MTQQEAKNNKEKALAVGNKENIVDKIVPKRTKMGRNELEKEHIQ